MSYFAFSDYFFFISDITDLKMADKTDLMMADITDLKMTALLNFRQ